MTYCCITCEFDKARANNAPGRRNLRPMIPPVAATRDAAAGATTTHKERGSAGYPTGRRVTLGGAPCACVANAPAAQLPSFSEPSCDRLGQTSSTAAGSSPFIAGLVAPTPVTCSALELDTYPRAGRNTTGVSGLAVRHEADVDLVVHDVGVQRAPTVGAAS